MIFSCAHRDTQFKADGDQVSRIKERVEEKEGIPPAQQRLIYGGKQMYVILSVEPWCDRELIFVA
jgi:hypothetical protein